MEQWKSWVEHLALSKLFFHFSPSFQKQSEYLCVLYLLLLPRDVNISTRLPGSRSFFLVDVTRSLT